MASALTSEVVRKSFRPSFYFWVVAVMTFDADGPGISPPPVLKGSDQVGVANLLEEATIADYFSDVVSTDELRSFKPNPGVYAHCLRRAGACGERAWLISGNPFDVIGAISAGMRGAWVKRTPAAIFDPWEIEPTVTIASLADLATAVQTAG